MNLMDEYIKRSEAIKAIEDDMPEVVYYRKEEAIACIECLPTADVVPRSEFDALRKELARYIKRDILRRYSNDKIATAVVLQMSPESFLEKEAEEIVADVERKTLEKMREA